MKIVKDSSLKAYGFDSIENGVHSEVANTLHKYCENVSKKLVKKYKGVNSYNEIHVLQQGGRVSMPIDYFGTPGAGYVKDALYPSMSPTETDVRPPLEQTFKPLLTGGKSTISISLQRVKDSIRNTGIVVTQKGAKQVKRNYELMMHKVLQKVATKTKDGQLKIDTFMKVLSEKQFQMLR